MSDKTGNIKHVKTCRDGGSILLEYMGSLYFVDRGIASPTWGDIFGWSDGQRGVKVNHILENRIKEAWKKSFKTQLP